MRRMISQKLQDLIKKLSKSIWADEYGNLEVGKDLEVDGYLTVNHGIDLPNGSPITFNNDEGQMLSPQKNDETGEAYLTYALFRLVDEPYLKNLLENYSKARYQHTVVISWGDDGNVCRICFTAMSSKNTPVDSYQDLNAVFGGGRYAVTGEPSVDFYPLYVDLHGGTVATDYVQMTETTRTLDNTELSFSSMTNLTITDDVSIPR